MVRRILCFGDSNTWGYIPLTGERYPSQIRWPGVMSKRIGSGYEIIEEGLNGRTTVWDDPIEGDKNGYRHLPVCLESHQPLDLVILMLGTNDLKARFSLTAFDIAAGVERLIKLIMYSYSGNGTLSPVILLAVPPRIDPQVELEEMFQGARQKSSHLATHYKAIADRYHCIFLDINQVTAVDPADGIHYSPQSHNLLGIAIADLVIAHYSSS